MPWSWVMSTMVEPARCSVVEGLEDLGAGPAVEVAGGLVGQHAGGLADDGPGDGDPLALAARQLPGPVRGPVGEADPLQRVGAPRRRRPPARTPP